jgi:hypothetical protein
VYLATRKSSRRRASSEFCATFFNHFAITVAASGRREECAHH